jgi:hypothetical protein
MLLEKRICKGISEDTVSVRVSSSAFINTMVPFGTAETSKKWKGSVVEVWLSMPKVLGSIPVLNK